MQMSVTKQSSFYQRSGLEENFPLEHKKKKKKEKAVHVHLIVTLRVS